jgi:uncharacterized protein (DUF305 family)
MTKIRGAFQLSVLLALLSYSSPVDRSVCAAELPAPFEVAPPADAKVFASLMAQAMSRMHAGMSVPDTHQPDRDFAAMMIPHHQGAVDMAVVELRFGHDERLRRLAQGIIVEQRQEIEVMRRILAEDSRQ